jgi:tripartite-type tricarboxylate transporter receptor subunit TctC
MPAPQASGRWPTTRRHALRPLAAAALLALALPTARAAEPPAPWPQGKPITWIVGFAPGGSLDVLTRHVARQLEARAGVSVVVENRPGASGGISLQAAAKAPADGLTLVSVPGPQLPAPRQPEVGRELTAVAVMARGAMVLVGPAAGAAGSLGELVAAMKAKPGQWSYASSGTGTSQHLAGELLNALAATSMVHVPYKGGGLAVPSGTPPERLAQLNHWINQAVQSPDLRPTLQAAGAVATPMSLPEIQRFMSQDNAKWKKLAADRRLVLD